MDDQTERKNILKWLRFFSGYYYMEYLVLRGAAALFAMLPLRLTHWLARKIGDSLFFCMHRRRRIALSNLDLAFRNTKTPQEKNEIARESFRNLMTSLLEFSRTTKTTKDAGKHFEIRGTGYLDQALGKGQGVVLAISHLGSWEYLAFLFFLRREYVATAVAKTLKNTYVSHWIQRLRRKTALRAVDKMGSARTVLDELRQNHLVLVLIDQWASSEGLWVDFLGEPTSTTSLPARLAKTTGCAIVPGYCFRRGPGQYEIEIHEEISLPIESKDWECDVTQALNRQLEAQIRRCPEQWIWTHRRWKGLEFYQTLRARVRRYQEEFSVTV